MKYSIFFLLIVAHLVTGAQSRSLPGIISANQALRLAPAKTAAASDSLQIQMFSKRLLAAKAGSAKDANAIGMCYYLGLGVAADESMAMQWFTQAGNKGYTKGWYNLGMMYKYGNGVTQDYEKAYVFFSRAAAAGDPSGLYAQGFMLYKGLGCLQDYSKAYTLFRKGAAAGSPSCMYFTGLCLRNGYGVTKNGDNALYWLRRAAIQNYTLASEELATAGPENNNAADGILQKIKTIQLNGSSPFNQYQPIPHSMPANDVAGTYKGFLVRYDWSGRYIVQSATLNVTLNYDNGRLTGLWEETGSNSITLNAQLTSRALLFADMQYTHADHYDAASPRHYNFENASLQLVKKGDSAYLYGNVSQFSPDTREPEKPIYIALVRTVDPKKSNPASSILLSDLNITAGKLQAYPNPFDNYFTVDFDLKESCRVQTLLYAQDGKLVYSGPAAQLEAGAYRLPVKANLPPGSYIVKLVYGKNMRTAVMIKQ